MHIRRQFLLLKTTGLEKMCLGHKVFYYSVPVLLEIFFAEIILSFSRDWRRNERASTAENGPTEIKTEMYKQNWQIQTILLHNEFLVCYSCFIRTHGWWEGQSDFTRRSTGWEGHTQLIPLMHSVIRQLVSPHAGHKMVKMGPYNRNRQQAVGGI